MESKNGIEAEAPVCVALTDTSPEISDSLSGPEEGYKSPFFTGAEWSPDGTTILTSSSDHHFRSYIV